MSDIVHQYWQIFLMGRYPNGPLGGVAMTIIVAVISILLSVPVSLLFALARLSSRRVISRVAAGIVSVLRGTPLLMLIFWAYYIIPKLSAVSPGLSWLKSELNKRTSTLVAASFPSVAS